MTTSRKALRLKLSVSVDDTKHEVDFDSLMARLKIDPTGIEDEASDQPGLYVWIGALAEEASFAATQAKRTWELYKSSLMKQLKSDPPDHLSGKRTAIAAFEAEVEVDDGTQELADQYFEALRIANLMGIAKEAARSRAGLIREIASRQRQEIGAGV